MEYIAIKYTIKKTLWELVNKYYRIEKFLWNLVKYQDQNTTELVKIQIAINMK